MTNSIDRTDSIERIEADRLALELAWQRGDDSDTSAQLDALDAEERFLTVKAATVAACRYYGGEIGYGQYLAELAAASRPGFSGRRARIIRKAEASIRKAELAKRRVIHTAEGKVNWAMTAVQKAEAMRLNRTIDRATRAIRRAEQGTIFA